MKQFLLAWNVTIFLGIIAGCLSLWIYFPSFLNNATILSFPIPTTFALITNNQVSTLDLWAPIKDVPNTNNAFLQISATSALSYDLDSNRYLYAKNITRKLPMASLTKIMTAIVSMEHPLSEDSYVVSQSAIVGNNMMGVSPGETLSLEELLYGLLLPSGNDAAEVLSQNFPGGRDNFIAAMNEKAKSLGLVDTHFTNPSGLEGDGDQYATAYDLLIMTHFALNHFPFFATVVKTYEKDIPQTLSHKEFDLFNETNLLTSYPGVEGVKDGYTPEAGLCLVTYLNYRSHHILAVILGSDDRRGEMKEILDYSLKEIKVTPPVHG